ncbi:MAG: hypothetical protein HYZ45_04800, partial [Burkholderiales bacterium]|nr:hypothetical protein [Burkholderiales bacterium]
SNDLALTYHKLQNDKRCLELLQPYAEDAGKNEAEIRDSYLPSEADSWLPVLKATRTNLRLCKGGK